jgi:hypothetical protein
VVGALAILALVLVVSGCGFEDGAGSSEGPIEDRPAPPRSEFPSTQGRTLGEVIGASQPAQLVVLPAASSFETGINRYSFGVFDKGGAPVTDAQVALYFAHVPQLSPDDPTPGHKGTVPRAQARALDEQAIGPFPARLESLETQPAFRAMTTSQDPGAARAVYVTNRRFTAEGEWRVAAVFRQGSETSATLLNSAVVGGSSRIPKVGQRPPVIHTPTPADVGGDLSKITTRVPPDTQNDVDFADVYGRAPIVLLLATPQFCESRVCGPVVDVAEEAKARYGDDAAFVHMEIYEDNEPPKTNHQVRAFHLATEPWLFAINRRGVITDRIEGAFGPTAMREALRSAAALPADSS